MTRQLDAPRLGAALAGTPWQVELVAQTGSTNTDLRAAALRGDAGPGHLLLAEHQHDGRGRSGRRWECAPGTGLTFSVLVDPAPVALARWGWLPLLAGLALADAGRHSSGVALRVKWPNDVLADDGAKIAGILCERVDTARGPLAIIGIGVNVSAAADQLPVATAGSFATAGAPGVDRVALLVAIARRLEARLATWRAAGGDAAAAGLADAYAAASATLGTEVSVELPGGSRVSGIAVRIDDSGALVLHTVDGERTVAAGDVTEAG